MGRSFATALARAYRKRSAYEFSSRGSAKRRRLEASAGGRARPIVRRRGFAKRYRRGRFRGRRGISNNWARIATKLTTRVHHNTFYSAFKSSAVGFTPRNVAFAIGNLCAPFTCNQTAGPTPYFDGATSLSYLTSTLTGTVFQMRDLNNQIYANGTHVYWNRTIIRVYIRNNSDAVVNFRMTVATRRRKNANSNNFNDWVAYWNSGDIYSYNRDDYNIHASRKLKFDLSTQASSQRVVTIVVPQNKIVWTQTRQAATSVSSWDMGWDDMKYFLFESDDSNSTNASDVCITVRNFWTEGYNS